MCGTVFNFWRRLKTGMKLETESKPKITVKLYTLINFAHITSHFDVAHRRGNTNGYGRGGKKPTVFLQTSHGQFGNVKRMIPFGQN